MLNSDCIYIDSSFLSCARLNTPTTPNESHKFVLRHLCLFSIYLQILPLARKDLKLLLPAVSHISPQDSNCWQKPVFLVPSCLWNLTAIRYLCRLAQITASRTGHSGFLHQPKVEPAKVVNSIEIMSFLSVWNRQSLHKYPSLSQKKKKYRTSEQLLKDTVSQSLSTVDTVNIITLLPAHRVHICVLSSLFFLLIQTAFQIQSSHSHISTVHQNQRFSRESLLSDPTDDQYFDSPQTQCSFWAMNLSPLI